MEIGWLVSKIEPPHFSLTVVVKGTFKLQHDGPTVPADEQAVPTGDEFEKDDRAKLLRYPMDLAPFKPRADLLMSGQCHAPDGKPAGVVHVSFKVGAFKKSLAVIGDRFWSGSNRTSEPVPFAMMPLGWDRAFGGPGLDQNPLGKGLKELVREDGSRVHSLPNVESLTNLIRDRNQRVDPAGFGPIHDAWPQRAKKFGNINRSYMKERWPWYPENMDWGYFNTAPEDQQMPSFLRGDEDLAFENLHPTLAQFRSSLPGIRIRCFLNELVRAHEELREIPMRLDTLWVQPDAERLILVWRGHVNVRTENLLEVYHLLVTSEPLAATPAPVAHFKEVLQAALARRDTEDEELEPEPEPDEDAGDETEPSELSDEKELESKPVAEAAPANLRSPEVETESKVKSDEDVEAAEEPPPPDPDDTLTVERVRQKLVSNESFAGCDLGGLTLVEFDFSGRDLREAILEGAVMVRANLAGANLTGAVLAGANLREANCAGAIFVGADFTETSLSLANFTGADLRGADLTKARARQANFKGAQAAESVWEEADLSEADLSGADFTAADLCKARLHRTNLTRANLTEAALEGAWGHRVNGRGAVLRKVRAASACFCEAEFHEIQADDSVWQFAQLYAANFTRACLQGAEMSSAYLGHAIFEAAELKSACLEEANLNGARLCRANLFGASLSKADLTDADLSETNLYGTSFMDTTLQHTKLNNANLRRIKAKEEIT